LALTAFILGELSKVSPQPPQAQYPGTERRFAQLLWEADKKRENPDMFLVPFADQIEQYPEGIENYKTYLESSLWKQIQSRVITKAGGECEGCQSKATQVHHRDYRLSVLAGEDDGPLVALCRYCHDKVHKNGNKRRDSWNESESVLASLIENKDAQLP
jgi:hypothetical protein